MKQKPSDQNIANCLWLPALAIGMCIGIGIGASLGSVGAGAGIGMGVGGAVGLVLRRWSMNAPNDDPHPSQESHSTHR